MHRLLPFLLVALFAVAATADDAVPPDETPGAAAGKAGAAAEEAGAAVETAMEEMETGSARRLPEVVVVTPTRGPREVFDIPRSVSSIPEETIRELDPIHLVDAMTRREPGIIMDIRTATTGDPIMRGFAGFNLLTLIDGNTLSTLWGEGGFGADDMYGKVDPDTIERIEIVRGPNSVLYGSNALGGVINFITRGSPIDYTDSGFAWGRRVKTTYYSVNDGNRTRAEVYGACPVAKFLLGWSYGHYGDAEGGRGVGTLDPTRGRESNWDLRTDWMVLPGHELTLSILDVTKRDTHRFYRPTQDNENDRTGISLAWNADELFDFMAPFQWRVYYQRKKDSRRFDIGTASLRKGYAETITWATDLQASTDVADGHYLTYGLHLHRDDGDSPDDEQFTFTYPKPKTSDAPESWWANYGVYLQDEWEAMPDLLTVTAALRYDYMVFNSRETSTYSSPGGQTRMDFFRDTTDAVTGGLGVTVKADDHWRFLGSYSRGFRQYAPNFGIRQLGVGVLIPNELLDPVTSNNYELGVRTRYPAFGGEGFLYYSDIGDWQDVKPTTFQGSNWYDYNGNGIQDANEIVVQYASSESAYVWGFELKGDFYPHEVLEEVPENWSLWGGFAWNRGKSSDGEYFRHTQPARGLLGIRWDDSDPMRRAYFELDVEMVNRYHRIPADRVQDDLAYFEDPQDKSKGPLRAYGGVPGYTVFSVFGGMNLCESTRLTVGIENLTNKKFRRAHSRMDAFGINLVVGLDVTF